MPTDTAAPLSTPGSTARLAWWRNEDWLAVIAGAALLAAALAGWKIVLPSLAWKTCADLSSSVLASANLLPLAMLSLIVIAVSALVLGASLGRQILGFIAGASVVLALAWAAQLLAGYAPLKAWGLEYVIFALGLGLLWSHLLPMPAWLGSAVRTEFFIKVGIVILGAGMLFGDLMKAGTPGMIQAALVIPVVWHITFRLARWLRVDDEFAVMLSSAVSICGVSAAIAACGAIQGDKKKLSYTTSVVLLCAVPMMIVMPWLVQIMGLSQAVGGAWLGGTLDTSGSVVAATEMVGETASKIGTVVKLSQNVLIGLVAFLISLWWSWRAKAAAGGSEHSAQAVSAGVIWERFPKFVLGFVAASLLFSFGIDAASAKALEKPLKGLREIWFAAAFVCIGLETKLGDIFKLGGGRPALAFLGGQAVNIVWTLLLAWWLFR